MEALKRKENSSLGCANILGVQMAGQANLYMDFSLLTTLPSVTEAYDPYRLNNFKPEPVLPCETHNFSEAPFPIKQLGYAEIFRLWVG